MWKTWGHGDRVPRWRGHGCGPPRVRRPGVGPRVALESRFWRVKPVRLLGSLFPVPRPLGLCSCGRPPQFLAACWAGPRPVHVGACGLPGAGRVRSALGDLVLLKSKTSRKSPPCAWLPASAKWGSPRRRSPDFWATPTGLCHWPGLMGAWRSGVPRVGLRKGGMKHRWSKGSRTGLDPWNHIRGPTSVAPPREHVGQTPPQAVRLVSTGEQHLQRQGGPVRS